MAAYLGMETGEMAEFFPWFPFTCSLDTLGPFQTAKVYGMHPDSLQATLSPLETMVLRQFEKTQIIDLDREPWLFMMMLHIGQHILEAVAAFRERLALLEEQAELRALAPGVAWLDASALDREADPTRALEIFVRRLEQSGKDVPVTVTQDPRGKGLTLYRRNDDPRVDFSRVQDDPGILFAHKGGLIAKTKEMEHFNQVLLLILNAYEKE